MASNCQNSMVGAGFTSTQKYIFESEMARECAPRTIPFGLSMVAPVIMEFGSQEQKDKFLPDILESNVCGVRVIQEPGSGSDLASLQCKAENKGDYVVNGTKIWTTMAQYADWIFCWLELQKQKNLKKEYLFY